MQSLSQSMKLCDILSDFRTTKKLRQIIREEIKHINEATLANDMYYRGLTDQAYKMIVEFVKSKGKNLNKMLQGNAEPASPWVPGKKWEAGKLKSKDKDLAGNFIGVYGHKIFTQGSLPHPWRRQGAKISYGFAPYGPADEKDKEKYTTAGFWTETNMFGGKDQQGTIIIYVHAYKDVLTQLKDKKRQSTFQHEYQHVLDSAGDTKDVKHIPLQKHKDMDAEFNSSREFNTYYQEFQDQTGKFFAKLTNGTPGERFAVWLYFFPPPTAAEREKGVQPNRGQKFKNFIKLLANGRGPEYDEVHAEWFASTMKHPKNRRRLIKRLQNLYEYFEKGIDAPRDYGPLSDEQMEKVMTLVNHGKFNYASDSWVALHPDDHPNRKHGFNHKIKWPAPGKKNRDHDTRGK